MKTAIVHDWLTGMRGGEKVLEQLCSLYPAADIYTLIYDPLKITGRIKEHRVFTSFLQRIPGILKNYRNFLPLFPAAVESFNLKAYDLVISSSHCVAKGAKAASPERHVCYCHTPMRYAWDQFSGYFSKERTGRLKYGLISAVMPVLRKWDVNTASRAGHFAANSNHVRNRINKYYGRDAAVVYPPVDTEFYTPPVKKRKKGYCLMVTALNEYKKVDFAVNAFKKMPGKKLIIIGTGPLAGALEKIRGENTELLGYKTDGEIREYYRGADAFIFPGEEDFGITVVEAQACGTPVVALNRGGALETVIEGATGEFFDGTEDDFIKTVEKTADKKYHIRRLKENAMRFSTEAFRNNFSGFMKERGY